MNVLLLRLCGPMQSWGVQSRFSVRDTGLEPSKSGVVGLLAAALGRPRDADITDLAALRMAVRVDAEGLLRYDYHTAQDVLKAGGGIKETEPSRRYYLADACFLVGLAGEDLALLQQLQAALQDPVWPLCLGRKAFVPGEPIWLNDGLRQDADLWPGARNLSMAWHRDARNAPTACASCWRTLTDPKCGLTSRSPSPSAVSRPGG